MSDQLELWYQDSPVKGIRIVRFERVGETGKLRWMGEISESLRASHFYHEEILKENQWIFLEYVENVC